MNEFLHLSKRIFFFLFVSVMCSLQFANAQTTLAPGDIAVIGFNITNGQFAFVTLTDISANTVVNFTDRGWTGSGFNSLATEGTITWTSSAAVSAGTVVTVSISAGPNPTITGFPNGTTSISGWTSASIFANNGDQTIVYQGSDASPTFVYGFSCSTSNGSPSTTLDWQTGTVTTNRDSQLPTGLTNSNNSNAATAIAFCGQNVNHNYVYNAKSHGFAGTRAEILTLIADRANWIQSPSAQDLSPNGANFPASFSLGAVITAPTTQASNVTFASTTTSSFTASWTNGNGSSRAVFIKAASSGSPSPANNTTYTGNAAFGSGTQIGATGWYCVYNGTGTSVPVTGLTGATAYQVMVVEYNGTSGTEKYQTNTAAGNPANVTTLTPNTPPVVTASGGSTTYSGSAVAVDNGITVSDADNTTLASTTITITGNFQSAEDLLAFTAGGTGNIAGSFNTTTGVFALTSAGATATIAQWQAALRAITYQNTAASPNTTTRTVTFVVNDGSTNSSPATKNITITVPVISTTGTLSALSTTYGAASSAGTFNVSGVNMAAGILVTAPTGFEVSKDNITFTNTVTVGSLGNIASTQVHIRLASGINAGDYSGNVVLSSTGAVSVNVATVTSTVNKAALTITANSDTKVYGAPVPTLTVSYSGFVGTDNASGLTTQPTISTTAVANSPVNTYPITASGAASSNYTFIYQPGTLTITPAALTITANSDSKVYGAPVPTLTVSYSGFVGTDNASSLTTQPTITTTAVANSPVNTYPITVSGAVSANYTFIYNPGTLTVTPQVLGITVNDATKTYGAAVPVLSVSYSGFQGTDDASSLTTQPTISTTAVTNSPVNTYPITASGAVSPNYTIVYNPGILTVTPAALTITANNKGKAFGQTLTGGPGSTEFTSTGLANAETIGSVTITYGTGAAAGAPANTYTGSVVASAATGGTFNSGNYTITYVAGNLTVGQAILTITANNATKTYGAVVPVLGVSYSGFVGTDDASSLTTQPTISTTAVTNSLVNTYPITASGAVSSNYTIVYQPGTLTITPAALTITANNATKTYGSVNPALTVSYSGFVGTDDASSLTTQPTISTPAVTNSPVNTYPITASGAVSANYTFIYNPGILTVTPAALTITANDATKTYGAANPALSVSYSGFVGTDNASSLTTAPTISTTAVTSSPVNTYPITASGAVSANYTFVYNPGTLTVTPAALTIMANDATKTYGSVNPALTVSYSGFVGTDNASSLTSQPTISTTAVTNSPVNTYPITASGAVSANYTFIYQPGTLTITPAALTITANDATKTYGAANPALTVSYSGFVGTDNASSLTTAPTISTTAVTGSPVNTYPITASGAVSANYTFIYQPGTLTITPAALTITANDATKTYGSANPVLSVSYSGFVGTDDASSLTTAPTISTTAVTGSPVNTYPITASGAASTNYSITYTPGILTVTPAALTITANNATKTYGSVNPALTVSYSGFVGTDDASSLTTQPTISTTAVTSSPVSTYPITASGAVSSNYTIVYQPGTLTITPAALTITANNATKTYGSVNPALTVSYSGFVGTDDASSLTTQPTISTPAVTNSPVNTYPITASGAVSANYTFVYNPGILTVTPAALTITANDATKTYGAVNPTLSVSYSGFVGTDDASSLTTQPTISTTAVTGSPVNTYPITASGAVSANYTIVYQPGTLTVTPAALTITANDATKTYGSANPVLSVSYSGFVGTDDASSLTTAPTISTTAVTGSPVNTYPITASGAVSSNYTFVYNPGTLTVTPAALTIAANDATKTYGSANPSLSVSYSGFVGTDNASSLTTAPTVTTTAVTGSPVNTYPITASGAVSANYTFIYNPGTLTITPAALTITANNATKMYGSVNPVLSVSYSGFVGTDNASSLTTQPTISTTAVTGSPVNTYPITASGAVSTNYSISYTPGTLTITPAALTITANDATKTYGAAVPVLSVSYSGFVDTDDASSLTTAPTISTTAVTNSPVNTYPITTTGAASANYTFIYNPGTLTVTPAALTITANDATKTYGSVNPALSVSYSGFVGTDNASSLTTAPTVSTTAVTNSPVNTYPITASGAVSANYTIVYKPGILTVTPTTLTITANNKNKLYGQAITGGAGSAAFTSTGLVNSETIGSVTIVYGAGAAANAAVNTYTGSVVASAATGGTFTPGNYHITYVAGNIVVSQITLTITANNQSKTYGAANPALSVSYSGFVNGDNSASLTTKPTIVTTATVTSAAGTYPITASGAAIANYNIIYAPGTLTVNKAMLTITADNKSRLYGTANPVLAATYSGFVNGDNQASLTAQPILKTVATTNSAPGTYSITASGAVSPNYSFNYVSGKLTIIPLSNADPINLTLSSGTLLPAFTPANFAYTTQVDNEVEHIRLTLTFDATATARVNGTLTPNDRPSYSIPLDEGNNTITVVVTAQDGTTINTYTVVVYRGANQKNLVVTNILTPNGDGKNDVWSIQDIQLFPNNIVTVYDRGGRTVYTKHGYTNDWNGTYGGSPLTEGTYYYIVDLGPQQRKFKGYITIVRNR